MEEYLSRWDALWLVLYTMFDKVTILGTIGGLMFFGIVAYFSIEYGRKVKKNNLVKNPAYQYYLKHEKELLKNHAGKYIWIVGRGEIVDIGTTLLGLLKKAEKHQEETKCPPNQMIVRKIEKDEKVTML